MLAVDNSYVSIFRPVRYGGTQASRGAEGDYQGTTEITTLSLQLPLLLKTAVEKLAAADGISANQFLESAAAEKLAAMQSAEAFFAGRKGRGDKDAAVRLLKRAGDEPPRPGDELPDPETGDGQRQVRQ